MILPLPPLPAGATDCHMHVFGPFERYPLAAERAYTVAEAPLEAHEDMKRNLGFERTVVVQASGYGNDNRAMLSALAKLGERGRGVAVFSSDLSISEMQDMHRAGVRGARLNLATMPSRYAGEPASLVRDYERLLAPLGWHLQVFSSSQILMSMAQALRSCSVPVVIDHMGLPDAAQGIAQPGFRAVLALAEAGHVWIKLAGADRITRSSGRLRDAVPFMQALGEVAPQRLVWGSDWPHIGFHAGRQTHGDAVLPYRTIDESGLLAVLFEAFPSEAMRQAILADNPADLYGWEK